jgi:hypothetical protein
MMAIAVDGVEMSSLWLGNAGWNNESKTSTTGPKGIVEANCGRNVSTEGLLVEILNAESHIRMGSQLEWYLRCGERDIPLQPGALHPHIEADISTSEGFSTPTQDHQN